MAAFMASNQGDVYSKRESNCIAVTERKILSIREGPLAGNLEDNMFTTILPSLNLKPLPGKQQWVFKDRNIELLYKSVTFTAIAMIHRIASTAHKSMS